MPRPGASRTDLPRLRTRTVADSLLLSTLRLCTFGGDDWLTNASGFFCTRDSSLFLVTSRHVLIDEPSDHRPDRVEIELHTNATNLAQTRKFSVPIYRHGAHVWRETRDRGGIVDVAALEIERAALPSNAVYYPFTPQHLPAVSTPIEIGRSLLVVGFPLGFYDTLHRMPVVRHAILASSFGLRFQGQGYFLTDARTHRGSSGAPVVMRVSEGMLEEADLPWLLLGIHSSRLDMDSRDLLKDEALGLNCAWYAGVLWQLTDP